MGEIRNDVAHPADHRALPNGSPLTGILNLIEKIRKICALKCLLVKCRSILNVSHIACVRALWTAIKSHPQDTFHIEPLTRLARSFSIY